MAFVRLLLLAAFVALLSGPAFAGPPGSVEDVVRGAPAVMAGGAADERGVPDAALDAEPSMDDPDDGSGDPGDVLLPAPSPCISPGAPARPLALFATTGLAASLGVPHFLFRPPRTLG